jgi:hypothetical protein
MPDGPAYCIGMPVGPSGTGDTENGVAAVRDAAGRLLASHSLPRRLPPPRIAPARVISRRSRTAAPRGTFRPPAGLASGPSASASGGPGARSATSSGARATSDRMRLPIPKRVTAAPSRLAPWGRFPHISGCRRFEDDRGGPVRGMSYTGAGRVASQRLGVGSRGTMHRVLRGVSSRSPREAAGSVDATLMLLREWDG